MDFRNFELVREDVVTKILTNTSKINPKIIPKATTIPEYDLLPFQKTETTRKYQIDDQALTLEKYFKYYPFMNITSKKEVDKDGNKILVYDVSSDIFTNSVLCSYLVSDLYQTLTLEKYGLDGYLLTYFAFVKDKIGYKVTSSQKTKLSKYLTQHPTHMTVYRGSDGYTVAGINFEILTSTLIQIFTNLKYLKAKLGLKSNRCSVDNWVVLPRDVNIRAYGINHRTSFLVAMASFDYTSITYVYSGVKINLYQQDEINEELIFAAQTYGYHILKPWVSFRAGTKTKNYVPVDWDGVLFVVSLLLVPEAYYSIITDPELFDLLVTKTFHVDDVKRLLVKIRGLVDRRVDSTYEVALEVATGVRFREGLIDRVVAYFGD